MLVDSLKRSAIAACAMAVALFGAAAAVAQVPSDEAHVAASADAAAQVEAPGADVAIADDATDVDAEPEATETVASEPAADPPATIRPHLDAARLAVAEQRGRSVYRRRCASCHGDAGDGRGPATRFLDVLPRNFTTGVYKWRATGSGELPTDADLMRTVRRGAPGTAMPGWDGRLSLRDIWATVQYIKTFSTRFREEEPVAPLAMPTQVPAFDAAARDRGRQVYVLLQCWTCHGMSGRGDGPAAATLRDDDDLPIVAYDFTAGQMRGGTRAIDIYRTFAAGVNGTPMPSYDEALIVGRDGYTSLDRYRRILTPSGLRRLTAFVLRMPTTEELWAMPADGRNAWGSRMRWDLVAYVLSLSEGSGLRSYLSTAPYVTR